MTECCTTTSFDSTGARPSSINARNPTPPVDTGSQAAPATFTHELDRATRGQQTTCDESRPTERKGEPQRRHPDSATLRATTAGSDGRASAAPERTPASAPKRKQVQLPTEAAGPKRLSASLEGNQAAGNADPGAGKDLAGKVTGEDQAASSPGRASLPAPSGSADVGADPAAGRDLQQIAREAQAAGFPGGASLPAPSGSADSGAALRAGKNLQQIARESQDASSPGCALPATPGGSDAGGAGLQQTGDSNPGLVSTPASKYGDVQSEACIAPDPFQGAEVGQSQPDATGPHSSPDKSPSAAAAADARSISAQPTDNASVVGEISPFLRLIGQEAFAWTPGAGLDLADLPGQTTASGSRAAQAPAGNGVRQNQATQPRERGGLGEADSASASSASSSKTSPSSSDNKSSGDAHTGDQGTAPDSGQSSHGKVDSTLDLSSSPKTFELPAQPSATSSAERPMPSTPDPASVPNPAGSSALDAWGDLAARADRIVTSAALSGGTDQAKMQVELRTEALGSMQLTASLEGDRVRAVIGVQTPAAHSWLVTELPALHQALSNQNLHLDHVSILERGGTDGSLDGDTKGRGGFRSPSDEPPRPSGEQIRSGAQSVNGVHASSEVEASLVTSRSGRLSVRA